jgi:hypothetical protein
MANQLINWLGLLSNVDASILNVKLEHGFEVDSMPFDELSNFIKTVERCSSSEAQEKIDTKYKCLNESEKMCYFIKNSLDEGYYKQKWNVVLTKVGSNPKEEIEMSE